MNSTNRGANRLFLLVVAILLLAAAAVALTLAVVPAVLAEWGTRSTSVVRSVPEWAGRSVIGTVGLLAVAVGVVSVLLALLLVVFVAKQGRGRTSRLVEQRTGSAGATLIDLGVPRALLAEHLSDRAEFVGTRISAYRVRRTPALKISVRCRRGVSPVDAAQTVIGALRGLDAILGEEIPALVQISGGFRSRTASRARLD